MVKVKSCMRVLSILVTWALEDAVQTADSMKARGYGYGKRTTFTIFKFTKQDGIMLSFIILVVIICFIGYGVGIGNLRFYPTIAHIKFDKLSILMYIDRKSTRLNSSHANISYAVFCLKKKK